MMMWTEEEDLDPIVSFSPFEAEMELVQVD
jgi:hypothetical protein